MKRINNILSTKSFFRIVVLYVLFFLFLSSGKELLHNHKPDIHEHDNCPVLVVNHILSSGISTHFELPDESSVEFNIPAPQIISTLKSKINITFLRGPPLV